MNFKKTAFFIILITFAAYFTTLKGFFISGDFAFLPFLNDGRFIDLLRDDMPFKNGFFIRPLGNLWWCMDYLLWRLNPLGYHIDQTALHALNSLLVALISFLLLKDKRVSLFAGILFALHPIHPEAVTWLAGRHDVLCAFFYLSALYTFGLYASNTQKRTFYLISVICYPLALLSKEMAITLPLVLILFDFMLTRKLNFKLYLPYIIITIIYLVWRVAAIGDIGGYRDSSGRPQFLVEFSLALILKGIGFHVPYDLFFPLNIEAFSNFFYQFLVVLLSVCLVVSVFFRRETYKLSLIFFGIAWIFITMIPVYNFSCVGSSLQSSRILYLPSVGFCITFAYVIGRLIPLQIAVSALYFTILLINNSVWNTAAQITSEVPRIVRSFSQFPEPNKLKLYFYLPDAMKGVWAPLGNGGLEGAVLPLLKPLTTDNVIVFCDANLGSNLGYTDSQIIDLRSPEFSQGLAKNIFYFRYNEKKDKVEDVTVQIALSLKNNKIPKASVINYDFHSKQELKNWKFYNLSDKFVSLNDNPYLLSPALNLSLISLGFIEIRMQAESRDNNTITPCEIWWVSNKDKEYNHRKRLAFPVELDGKIHIYKIPFRIYKPDWLAGDAYMTELEFHPTSCLSEMDIEYLRFIPYEF
jgi:hypothetical protein